MCVCMYVCADVIYNIFLRVSHIQKGLYDIALEQVWNSSGLRVTTEK